MQKRVTVSIMIIEEPYYLLTLVQIVLDNSNPKYFTFFGLELSSWMGVCFPGYNFELILQLLRYTNVDSESPPFPETVEYHQHTVQLHCQ